MEGFEYPLLSVCVMFNLRNIPEYLKSVTQWKEPKNTWQPLILPWMLLWSSLPYKYKDTQQYPKCTCTNDYIINAHLVQSVWHHVYCTFEVDSGGLKSRYKHKSWSVINSYHGSNKMYTIEIVQICWEEEKNLQLYVATAQTKAN